MAPIRRRHAKNGSTVTINDAISRAWSRLRERIEVARDLEFDHEFTLQFHLAWEVARILGFPDTLGVRFEVPCGCDADGETIRLDLLLWIDPNAKVAVELKSPIRSATRKNSAMTNFRMRFYRDLHRLRHLVESHHNGITSGCFVAVVNERSYVVERGQRVNRAYRTYHGTLLAANAVIAPEVGPNGYPYPLRMPPHEVSWDWQCEPGNSNLLNPIGGMKHFWLKPIFVKASSNL
jgi:hypothetical protein